MGGLLMIVITGGGGFIGSNLAAALEDRGAGDLVWISDRAWEVHF